MRKTGAIVYFCEDRRWGYIAVPDEVVDTYFAESEVNFPEQIAEGTEVEFEIAGNAGGGVQAVKVVVVQRPAGELMM